MFGKFVMGAAVAMAALALAAPAHASGPSLSRWASFGNNGGVMLLPTDNGTFIGEADFSGLKAGDYQVRVSQWVDANHDGVGETGVRHLLCAFHVRADERTEMCRGNAGPLLGTGTWSDINRATLLKAKVTNGHRAWVAVGRRDLVSSGG